MKRVVLFLALVFVAPAQATVEEYLPGGIGSRIVVAPDGSTAGYKWSAYTGLFSATAKIGEKVTYLRDATSIPFVAPLPGGGAIVVMPYVGALIAGPDGTLGTDEMPIGTGSVQALYANRSGDAVLVLGSGRTTSTQFRPAGGTFGAPVQIDDDSLYGNVAISDDGETLVATRGPGVRVFSSRAAPVTLSDVRAKQVVLTLDARGRALAAWDRGRVLHTAFRGRNGRWHLRAPVQARRKLRGLAVSTSPGGDAVLAYDEGGAAYATGGDLYAITATLGTGRVSRPERLSRDVLGYPRVSVARDGSALVVQDREPSPQTPHILMRSGTGPFCETASADDPAGLQSGAGLTDDGTAVVLVGDLLLRDAARVCSDDDLPPDHARRSRLRVLSHR